MFYQSIVASVVFPAVACWGGGTRTCSANKLGELVRRARSVVGKELDSLEAVTEKRMRGRLRIIMDDPSHPLYVKLRWLRRRSRSHSSSHVPISHQTPQCHSTQYLLPPLTVTHNHTPLIVSLHMQSVHMYIYTEIYYITSITPILFYFLLPLCCSVKLATAKQLQ